MPTPNAPGLEPLPQVASANPTALPAAVQADPVAVEVRSGMSALREAMGVVEERSKQQTAWTENRNRLRAGEPQPNLGKIIWEQQWGNG